MLIALPYSAIGVSVLVTKLIIDTFLECDERCEHSVSVLIFLRWNLLHRSKNRGLRRSEAALRGFRVFKLICFKPLSRDLQICQLNCNSSSWISRRKGKTIWSYFLADLGTSFWDNWRPTFYFVLVKHLVFLSWASWSAITNLVARHVMSYQRIQIFNV